MKRVIDQTRQQRRRGCRRRRGCTDERRSVFRAPPIVTRAIAPLAAALARSADSNEGDALADVIECALVVDGVCSDDAIACATKAARSRYTNSNIGRFLSRRTLRRRGGSSGDGAACARRQFRRRICSQIQFSFCFGVTTKKVLP